MSMRLAEVRMRIVALSAEIKSLEEKTREHETALKAKTTFFSRLMHDWRDDTTFKEYQKRQRDLKSEFEALRSEYFSLDREISRGKRARSKFLHAQRARTESELRRRVEAEARENFRNQAVQSLTAEFDRANFLITRLDYRRGNSIDNYFQKIQTTVLESFGNCCLFCGTTTNLSLDHYALSKNEGGNFVLIAVDKASIRLNVIVLCRACNAAKSQFGYQVFFNDSQRERAASCQRRLLERLLQDKAFLELIRKWSR